MRNFLLIVALLCAIPAFAQNPTGSITAAGTTCTPATCVRFMLPTTGNTGTVVVQITGTFVATVQFEASGNPADETSYVAITGVPIGSSTTATSATAAGVWQFSTAGILAIQVRASAYTSGTASVFMQRSDYTPSPASSAVTGVVTVVGICSSQPCAVKGAAADGGASNNPFAIGVEDNGNVTNIVDTPKYQGNSQVTGSRLIPGAIYGKDTVSGFTVPAVTTGGGLAVTIVEGTGVTDYSGTGLTITTIALTGGTDTVFATATTYVTMMRCYNITGTAATIARKDTAGNLFENAYSIPANSNYYLESPGSFTKMVGIKLAAGTASAISCIMTGKQ